MVDSPLLWRSLTSLDVLQDSQSRSPYGVASAVRDLEDEDGKLLEREVALSPQTLCLCNLSQHLS